MKHISMLIAIAALAGCAHKPCQSEGAIHQLRHYSMTNQVSATESQITTMYVIGVVKDGKAVELTTIEGEARKQ